MSLQGGLPSPLGISPKRSVALRGRPTAAGAEGFFPKNLTLSFRFTRGSREKCNFAPRNKVKVLVFYARHPQHRHHSPRGPRQDNARRQNAAGGKSLPEEPERRGTHPRQQRPRKGKGHHHSLEERVHPLQGHQNQHHRHPGPLRLRRGGGTRAQHGRRLHSPRRRLRRPHAPDALRAPEGARDRTEAHRGRQQGGQAQLPPRGGLRNGV